MPCEKPSDLSWIVMDAEGLSISDDGVNKLALSDS